MPFYMVSYDLRGEGDYQNLYDELDRLDGHKALESVYLIDSTYKDAAEFRAHLKKFVATNDGLLIVEFCKRPVTNRALSGSADWIESKFPSKA